MGTAKDVNIGPAAVMSLLTAEFTHQIPQLAAVLSLICGVAQLLMGLLNIGENFVYFIKLSMIELFIYTIISNKFIEKLLRKVLNFNLFKLSVLDNLRFRNGVHFSHDYQQLHYCRSSCYSV